ncbi:MAG TPA: glycosyltransferase, partial [Thermoanaerobaculia bacterium]|nr:glycosyltransferase [Thermoanaerobaculia bacterium]
GVVVFHARDARALLRRRPHLRDATLVGIRADNREPLIADFEVVQNGCFADSRRRFFIPFWPQPGLLPRHPGRGTAIARAAFKGFNANLHPDFRSPAWKDFLAARGIEWQVDSVEFAGAATDIQGTSWADFRAVDLILAVRPQTGRRWTSKPASKLYNAWHAGVPALLGPEAAFRELRRSPLDYLEVASRAEAQSAVDRLLADPGLYRAMVDNGRARAVDFTAEAILPKWATLLYETIPPLTKTRSSQLLRRVPLPLRKTARRLARLIERRPAR